MHPRDDQPSQLVATAVFGLWGRHTLFRCRFIEPLASMVAVSPRRETTLPRMRTVWLVNESRYLALMRGVASEAIVDVR